MNMRGILAVGLVLIFVLMASASAADNATIENSTQSDAIAKSGDIIDDINVTFDEKMWQENLSDISVELPEEASGEFCIKLNNEAIYNETITDHSFKVPIKLPKPDNALVINIYPPLDFKAYKVSAFYNGIDLNLNRSLRSWPILRTMRTFGFLRKSFRIWTVRSSSSFQGPPTASSSSISMMS